MASTRGREDDRRSDRRGGRDDRRSSGRDDRRSSRDDRDERRTRGRDDEDRRDRRGGSDRGDSRGRDRDDRGGRDRGRDDRGGGRDSRGGGHWLRNYDDDAPSYDEVKKLSESRSGRFDMPFKSDYPIFRAAGGSNSVRILPKTWEGEGRHWAYQVWMHRFVGSRNGTYVCPKLQFNKPRCPICEAEEEARKDGAEEEARDLAAKSQWVCWVLDRDGDNPDEPQIWSMSEMQGKDIVNLTWDEKRGDTQHISGPNKGRDLAFIRSQRGNDVKTTRYSSFKFDLDSSPIHDDPDTMDDIIDYIEKNPIPDTIKEYEIDYLEGIMSGTAQETDEDLDDRGGGRDDDRGGDEDRGGDDDRGGRGDRRSGRAYGDEDRSDDRRGGSRSARGSRDDDPPFDKDKRGGDEGDEERGDDDTNSEDEEAGGKETSQDYDHEEQEARASARSSRGGSGRRARGNGKEPEAPEDRGSRRGSGGSGSRRSAPSARGREERTSSRRSARGR